MPFPRQDLNLVTQITKSNTLTIRPQSQPVKQTFRMAFMHITSILFYILCLFVTAFTMDWLAFQCLSVL